MTDVVLCVLLGVGVPKTNASGRKEKKRNGKFDHRERRKEKRLTFREKSPFPYATLSLDPNTKFLEKDQRVIATRPLIKKANAGHCKISEKKKLQEKVSRQF